MRFYGICPKSDCAVNNYTASEIAKFSAEKKQIMTRYLEFHTVFLPFCEYGNYGLPDTFIIVEWPLSKKCIIKEVTMKVNMVKGP